MITARGWGTHHLRQSGMGGGGRGRCHHLKDDFGRRMVALLGFERSGGEECGGGGEVVFKYERKRRSGHKVDLRRGGGSGTRGGEVVVAAAGDVVVTGGGGGGGDGDKVCADCKTTRTPLWRTGPCGPKSLCNACGIRYRKMRRKGGNYQSNSKSSSSGGIRPSSFGISPSESEMLKQRQRRQQEGLWLLLQQSRKFASTCGKEEAEAAVLLMALSTGLFVHS